MKVINKKTGDDVTDKLKSRKHAEELCRVFPHYEIIEEVEKPKKRKKDEEETNKDLEIGEE